MDDRCLRRMRNLPGVAAGSRGLAKRGGKISRSQLFCRITACGVLLLFVVNFCLVFDLPKAEYNRRPTRFRLNTGPQADDASPAPGLIHAPPTIRRVIVIFDALGGSKSKKENIERIPTYLGFQNRSFSVFQATTTAELNFEDCLKAGLITKNYSKPLSKVAVHLSHSRVWQKVVDENLDGLTLILEDDINLNILSKADMATALEVTMNNIPADAGLVMLGRCWDNYKHSTKINSYVVRPATPLCRHAYAVDVEMAKNLLALAWPLSDQNGDEIFRKKELDMTRAYSPTCSILMQDRTNFGSKNCNNHVHSTYSKIGGSWEDRFCPLTNTSQNLRGSQWEADRKDWVDDQPCSREASSSRGLFNENSTAEMGVHSGNPLCPRGARNFFHVVVCFHNVDYPTLRKAVTSITRQDYPADKFRIWLVDDGSNHPETLLALSELCGANKVSSIDEYDEVQRLLASEDTFASPLADLVWCLRLPNRLGPGGSKYMGFRLVESLAEPHEVVLVVDGDDMLSSAKALEIINAKYINESVWFTYGSFRVNNPRYQRWSKQVMDLPVSGPFSPRDERNWRYGHPRSFKAHLLPYISREDFMDANGSWLQKASDRGFIYRTLELSGQDRVGYIPETIYEYRYSETDSTLQTVPAEKRRASLDHVLHDMPHSEPLQLPIHVVLVLWKRIPLLRTQLDLLANQTVLAKGQRLKVHLVNNNPNRTAIQEIDATVAEFREQQVTVESPYLEIRTTHNKENWHAFSRFLYIRDLRKSEAMDFVILVDDDQVWDPHYVESLVDSHRPKSMTTWYGKRFAAGADYWNSYITYGDIIRKRKPGVKTFTYGGPGGCIIDTNLWALDYQLFRLQGDLQDYFEFDDIWVSYVLDNLLGWNIFREMEAIPVTLGSPGPLRKDTWGRYIDGILNLFSKEEKEAIRAVGTHTNRKTKKSAMLQGPQFKWLVQDEFRCLNRTPNLFSKEEKEAIRAVGTHTNRKTKKSAMLQGPQFKWLVQDEFRCLKRTPNLCGGTLSRYRFPALVVFLLVLLCPAAYAYAKEETLAAVRRRIGSPYFLKKIFHARNRAKWKYVSQLVFWLLTWYVCSLVNLLMVKTLLSEKGGSPVGIGMVQMSVTALFGAIKVLGPGVKNYLWNTSRLKRKSSELYPEDKRESPRRMREEERVSGPKDKKSHSIGEFMRKPEFGKNMLVLGALRGSTVLLGLTSLSYIAASFTETIKASAPLVTVLFAWLILGERTSMPRLLSLFPVMAGLVLCTANELSFHMIGFLAALMNNFLDCIQNVVSKKMMKSHVTPVQLQFFTSVAGSFFQLPTMLWQLRESASSAATAHTKPAGSEMAIYMLICGVFFHIQSVSAYCTMSLLSPVTQSVANTLKRTLLIFISILYFENVMLATNIVGILMVVSGAALYNYFCIAGTPVDLQQRGGPPVRACPRGCRCW